MNDRRSAEPNSSERMWTGHREAQRRRLARLPLADKIAWLEETQRVIEHLVKQRVRKA